MNTKEGFASVNTRKFPRTASGVDGAFRDVNYASSIERWPADRADVIVIVGCLLGLIALGVMAMFGML